MPLLTPILDDRTFDELRKELVDRLTVYNREYTDQFPADPVITLLELMASLGETLLYRFNQIPEATRLAFLRLLDVPLLPAVAAQGLVQFTWRGTFPARLVDASTLIERGTVVQAGSVSYSVTRAVDVFPFATRAVARTTPRTEPGVVTLMPPGLPAGVPYDVSPIDPSTPVELDAAVDDAIWVAMVADDRATQLRRSEVPALLGERVVSIGLAFDGDPPPTRDTPPCAHGTEDGSELICEAMTGRGLPISTGSITTPPIYAPCLVERDTTRGLRSSGVLRLRLPVDVRVEPAPPAEAGVGDNPPILPNIQDDQNVVCWIRIRRRDPASKLEGRIRWVGANATQIAQGEDAPAELLGIGTGDPGQRLALVHRNPEPTSILVEVEEQPGEWIRWTSVESLAGSGPRDRHVVLDGEAGTIRCGDGTAGLPFPRSTRIRVRPYRFVAGAAGNVKPGAISRTAAPVTVSNPVATWGGADEEPLAQAIDRVPGEIRRRDRAVTASDFAEIAMMAPGADVGRAEALAVHRPSEPDIDTAGAVTVVVWPSGPLDDPHPVPTRTTLDLVCRALDQRRLVTTELYVVAPRYRHVAISIGIEPQPGVEIEAVKAWTRKLLGQFLSPLPPFGPDGRGWPLGRALHLRELEAVALQVEGVRFVSGLRLAQRREITQSDPSKPRIYAWEELTANPPLVELQRDEVPGLVHLRVDRNATIDPVILTNPPVPATGTSLFVPIADPTREC